MGIFVILELAGWAKKGNIILLVTLQMGRAWGVSVSSENFLALFSYEVHSSTTHVIRNTTTQCVYFEILLSQAFLQKYGHINFVVQIRMDLD